MMVVKPYRVPLMFIDAGLVDMFGVMKAIVKNKYNGTIYPEHTGRWITTAIAAHRQVPRGRGHAGITYSVAYARAMMQAALETV